MIDILIADDEDKMRHLLAIILSSKGYNVTEAANGLEALTLLSRNDKSFDIVISDIKMEKMDGLELLNRIKEKNIPCPLIFITAFATVDTAVDAMRQGAIDYITKPFEEERILLAVERTLRVSRLMAENRDLKEEIKRSQYSKMIIASNKMKQVMNMAAKVARTNSTVLLTGESGTGKEVVAHFIHAASSRKAGRFVPVNCAAISPQLVESELFGHEKGSFTGAIRKKTGRFEYADNGTLFLDEVGDLPLEAQAKLLRTLQDGKIQPVGSNQETEVNVRVVCATNQNMEELVQEKRFRQDLFYRLNVFPITLPPLRTRRDGILPLCEFFFERFGGGVPRTMSREAANIICNYPWPGNVRELANAIERLLILLDGRQEITAADFDFLRSPMAAGAEQSSKQTIISLPATGISLDEVENQLVNMAMRKANNNQTKAANLLGLSRARFRVLIKKNGAD